MTNDQAPISSYFDAETRAARERAAAWAPGYTRFPEADALAPPQGYDYRGDPGVPTPLSGFFDEELRAMRPAPSPGLPTDSDARKGLPVATGVLDYFPDAIAEVARLSKIGNDKHNPGEPLHWARDKSTDHADCILRHMIDRGRMDTDGVLHDVKVAWRALAQLQVALEQRRQAA